MTKQVLSYKYNQLQILKTGYITSICKNSFHRDLFPLRFLFPLFAYLNKECNTKYAIIISLTSTDFV